MNVLKKVKYGSMDPKKCQGFWNDKKNNQLYFSDDGWLKTGDIGYIDKKAA